MINTTPILGAEIIDSKDNEGIVIDKARGYCNGASPTIYICMRNNGTVFEVGYDGIKSIKSFTTHPESDYSKYLDKK